jgi:hypothetical protein
MQSFFAAWVFLFLSEIVHDFSDGLLDVVDAFS